MISKSYIYLLVLISTSLAQTASEGTQGFYISPHGISRQREVHAALDKIASRIIGSRTTYNHLGVTYTADNFTIKMAYLDGRQTIDITGSDEVFVTGGKVEFQYLFNFTKVESGKTTNGYASGSVVSDSLNYTKMLFFGSDGHLAWAITPSAKGFSNLTISNRMKIKRMEPYSEADLSALEDILDRALTQIIPSTLEVQILQKFNSIMPMTLNTTLNSYILGPDIDYTFHHPTKGPLNMSIVHHLFKFDVKPEEGYKVIYLTEIKDWPEPVCDGVNVPEQHLSFDFYGGSQNIHLNCLYQEVVQYMQKKGWLDTRLDTTWDTNAFQFYAGDLYDLINNLYSNASPRQLLDGQCKASADKLKIKHGRDTHYNILELDVTYSCTAKTRNRDYKYIDVLNFTVDVKFFIDPKADKIELDFSIMDAEVINMDFKPVGNYYVGNLNLALFKAQQVIRKLRGTKTFGTGFQTIPRELPATQVTENYTIYFDQSHTASPSIQRLQI